MVFTETAFEFLRNDVLDARNFFDQTRPPFQRNQFGGGAGGPIIKNKIFWFASYDGLRQRKGLTAAGLVPTPAMLRRRLFGAAARHADYRPPHLP